MKKAIEIFCNKIRKAPPTNELIDVQNFKIDEEHRGYLFAYKGENTIHIDVSASVGDVNFDTIENAYCCHSLHEHLYATAIENKEITLEWSVERLMKKVIAQLDILAPHQRNAYKNGLDIDRVL